jgi:hypothetical protein
MLYNSIRGKNPSNKFYIEQLPHNCLADKINVLWKV